MQRIFPGSAKKEPAPTLAFSFHNRLLPLPSYFDHISSQGQSPPLSLMLCKYYLQPHGDGAAGERGGNDVKDASSSVLGVFTR